MDFVTNLENHAQDPDGSTRCTVIIWSRTLAPLCTDLKTLTIINYYWTVSPRSGRNARTCLEDRQFRRVEDDQGKEQRRRSWSQSSAYWKKSIQSKRTISDNHDFDHKHKNSIEIQLNVKGIIDLPPRILFKDHGDNLQEVPSWDSNVVESHVVRVIYTFVQK